MFYEFQGHERLNTMPDIDHEHSQHKFGIHFKKMKHIFVKNWLIWKSQTVISDSVDQLFYMNLEKLKPKNEIIS